MAACQVHTRIHNDVSMTDMNNGLTKNITDGTLVESVSPFDLRESGVFRRKAELVTQATKLRLEFTSFYASVSRASSFFSSTVFGLEPR